MSFAWTEAVLVLAVLCRAVAAGAGRPGPGRAARRRLAASGVRGADDPARGLEKQRRSRPRGDATFPAVSLPRWVEQRRSRLGGGAASPAASLPRWVEQRRSRRGGDWAPRAHPLLRRAGGRCVLAGQLDRLHREELVLRRLLPQRPLRPVHRGADSSCSASRRCSSRCKQSSSHSGSGAADPASRHRCTQLAAAWKRQCVRASANARTDGCRPAPAGSARWPAW